MKFSFLSRELCSCTLAQALCAAAAMATTAQQATAQSCAGSTISASCTGPFNWNSGDLVVASDGTIAGTTDGVHVGSTDTVGTLTNAGTITGAGDTGGGIDNLGTIASLVNNGTLSGTGRNADGLDNKGTIKTLVNNGTITGTSVQDTSGGYGVGIWNVGTIDTLTNTGTITGSNGTLNLDEGIFNSGTIALLTNSGTIIGSGVYGGAGIDNEGIITSLINNGTIGGSSGDDSAAVDTAIDNNGTITTLTNNGIIAGSGSSNGFGIDNGTDGHIGTLTNTGTISGGQSSDDLGIANWGTIGTLTNTGTIVGSSNTISGALGAGIANWSTIGTLTNSGTISGGGSGRGAGIYNGGTITSLINSGTIAGGHGAGIFNGGTIDTLTNSGTITGTVTGSTISSDRGAGINNYGGTITALINSGTITGSQYAIYSSGTIGLITDSGMIAGNIVSTKQGLTFAGGSDGIAGTLTGLNSGVGTITAPSVTFTSGAMVLGDDIVTTGGTGTVTNTASLRVNQTIGITGNYVQGSDGTLTIGVTSTTDSGALAVSGSADLTNGHISLVATNGGTLTAGTYRVVSAGTLSATAVTVETVLPETTAIRGNDLVVTLSSWTQVGNQAGGRAKPLGPVLDGLTSDSAYTSTLIQLSSLPTAQQHKTLKQLNVSPLVSQFGASGANLSLAASAIDQRVMMAEGKVESSGNALWGQILGGISSLDTAGTDEGYTATVFGVLLGADTHLTDDVVGGLAVSWLRDFSKGQDDISGHTARIDSYQLTLYSSWRPNGGTIHGEALLGAAYNQYDQKRAIDFLSNVATADYQGWQYHAKLSAGYDISLGDLTATPLASIHAVRIENNAYAEKGAGVANLAVGTQGFDSVESELGAGLAAGLDLDAGRLYGDVKATWLHSYTDSPIAADAVMGGQSFVSTSVRPGTDGAHVTAGVTWQRSDTFSLSLEYDGDIRPDYRSHIGLLKVRCAF